ncbi:MAG: hypothetical protein C4567_02485 [Deltaproteobacteria bacterium]|nr:MAG: hypothetical protein C4567_02485 [Deltaproteobacteria bacterium]
MNLRKSVTPVLLSLLFLFLAVPLVLAYSGHYYVIPNSAQLRECANYDCPATLTAYQGERVEILERTGIWSRVRFVDRSGWGWIPSDLLSYSPDRLSRPTSTYYVNTSRLSVYDEPTPNSRVVLTLGFNDPVEMLGVGASGMAQVRDLKTSVVGWAAPRYLSSSPLKYPKSQKRRRAPKAAPKEEAPEPPKAM